jgi:hypothetical protein
MRLSRLYSVPGSSLTFRRTLRYSQDEVTMLLAIFERQQVKAAGERAEDWNCPTGLPYIYLNIIVIRSIRKGRLSAVAFYF